MEKFVTSWLAVAMLTALSVSAFAQQPPKSRDRPALPSSQIEVPQQTTATYADWVVQCQTQAGPPVAKVCDMAQVTQIQGKGIPFSRIAIAQPVKGQGVRLVVQVPVNASFASDVRIQTADDDPGIIAPFVRCLPVGCFSDFELKDDMLKKLRAAGGVGKMTFADAAGHDISVPMSFNGFGQAFDALARE
jgi:invasion protein IalB